MNNKALAGKWPLMLICALFAALLTTPAASLPIGLCTPSACPEGYMDGGVSCADGTCTRTCVTGECGGPPTTVYTKETNLDDFDQNNIDSVEIVLPLGTFTPITNDKCYVFRQTTPSGFISSSEIDDYDDLHDFDSAIALFWETDSSKWYDNQHFYCSGESSQFTSGSTGAVWIDSDYDNGDDFDSADSLSQTNYLYCAPNSKACVSLNGNCDTDCYGKPTSLRMSLNADLQNNFDTHSFGDFCNDDDGDGSPVIDYVNFDDDLVHMYVDEYELVNKQNNNQQCQYWPECNPADACCTSDGHFRPSGQVCNSAHNAQCLTANSAGCGGVAYEDRCTGASSACPDNNFEIDYDKACDDATCVEQSCSGSTLQPQRTCSGGACQRQATYACPYNLGCTDAKSCKTAAVSQGDCGSEATYDANLQICYEKGGDELNISYDKNGNLASGLGLEYVYDSFNQLTTVKDSTTGIVKEEYSYDHSGNRRKKVTHNSDGSIATVYYVSDNFIQIVNSSGTYNETYYYANGKLVGKKDAAQSTLFFHPDHLGSTRLVTGSSANVVADLSYKPFGELIDNAKERFLYTGKELDSTGSYYLGARYLSPAQLYTFTQPDMNIPDIYNPQDLNRYTYARNNPYTYTDPNGESPTIALGIAGTLVAGGLNMGIQLWQNGGDFRSVDYASVAVSAGAGFIAGVTMGIGTAALGTSTTAMVTSGAFSGVAAGQTEIALTNYAEGAPPTKGLLQPGDITIQALSGGVGAGVGNYLGSTLKEVYLSKLLAYLNKGGANPKSGITVIGSGDAYKEVARRINANHLAIAPEKWTWQLNKRFLDEALQRGDDILYATPLEIAGRNLRREMNYLLEKGWDIGWSTLS